MTNVMMSEENVGYDKAYAFAIRIVNVYKHLTTNSKEYTLSKQLLRSGTSIGANLSEAKSAFSTKDLSFKVSIAYKEAQETKYWLDLLKDTGFLLENAHTSLYNDVDEICAILFSTLKTNHINKQ